MYLSDLFDTDYTHHGSEELVINMARELAYKVDELESELENKSTRIRHLEYMLRHIGAELNRSSYNNQLYVSFCFVSEREPMFQELIDLLDLKLEEESNE